MSQKWKSVLKLFPFLLPFLFSHQSHDPAHAEDGSSRSRCCACGNTLLLQGEDGQPGSDPSLHKGQRKHTKTECHANLGLSLDLVFKKIKGWTISASQSEVLQHSQMRVKGATEMNAKTKIPYISMWSYSSLSKQLYKCVCLSILKIMQISIEELL